MPVEYVTPSAWLDYMEDKLFLTGQLGPIMVDINDEDGHATGEERWEDASGCEVDEKARCCLGHYVDASGLADLDYSVGLLEVDVHVEPGHWLVGPATEEMVRWVQARMSYHWHPFDVMTELDPDGRPSGKKWTTRHDLPVVQDLFAHINDQVWAGLDRGPIRRRLLRGFIRMFLVPRYG